MNKRKLSWINASVLLTLCFLLLGNDSYAQEKIYWTTEKEITLEDFKSPTTTIGSVEMNSLQLGATIELGMMMSSAEFMFTKNFNDKVSATMQPYSSVLIATDEATSEHMIRFANYQFDLCELYARKLRKGLFDVKKLGSSILFIQNQFDGIMMAYTNELSSAMQQTNLGLRNDLLEDLHQKVIVEILELDDFCKECKLPKKK